ncbi:hypothetical protein [uncultured Actinomyces sp.]|uniref:hypothetical protein n=1 Tax=uncultured Actinomyces sp. TaxID=249061 RepID=UPI00261F7A33|nr:hypothetical protein [uncultured Actinomyces sp.]
MTIIAFVLGLAALIATLWLRKDTPSSRAWETENGIVDERFAFVFLPSFTILLFGLGIIGLSGLFSELSAGVRLLFILGCLLSAVGTFGTVAGLFSNKYPLWLLPKWRLESPHRK